jgi:sugar lactone lactonase YvrE
MRFRELKVRQRSAAWSYHSAACIDRRGRSSSGSIRTRAAHRIGVLARREYLDAGNRDEKRTVVMRRVYISGPGGLWILPPAGRHLGTIVTPEHAHNSMWGDDGRSLYVTARSTLYRIRSKVAGAGVVAAATK